ncbi:MAG: DUF3313 family protein [Steroidobacteraceae bacterium]
MNVHMRAVISFVAVLSMTGLWAASAMAADPPPATTPDGLELVKNSKLDLVYRRPGVDLAPYTRIILDPVEVAFKKQWTQDFRRVSGHDRERIRSELAQEFHDILVEELQTKGGYQIVEAPGPDVLRFTAGIFELYINAPDTMSAGRSRTYALSTGEATLGAELVDSESGALIARAADHVRARESATMQWITRSQNRADARAMLRKWATTLREGLDAARGVSK